MQLDATKIASVMLGNAIGTNLLLVGYAWQSGLIPLGVDSIMQAIGLNGTEVAMNRRAFGLGRLAAARPDLVGAWLRGHEAEAIPDSLGDLLADRMPRLVAWRGPLRGQAWAKRYRALVARVEAAEGQLLDTDGRLSRAVAHVAAKLMTYKDEYEVGRLFSDPGFAARLRETFDGDVDLRFNLAPPLFARRDKATGRPAKRRFGPWMAHGFAALARLRVLRGTKADNIRLPCAPPHGARPGSGIRGVGGSGSAARNASQRRAGGVGTACLRQSSRLRCCQGSKPEGGKRRHSQPSRSAGKASLSPSFPKKTKQNPVAPGAHSSGVKVFCFFFPKKKPLPTPRPLRLAVRGWPRGLLFSLSRGHGVSTSDGGFQVPKALMRSQ